ncbi:MAG: hypothetical protein M1817_006661 [Caeruleum heppii]|nr:MAG: hypothetical protein M1817_006661 [Caeruleum heppii]
MFIFTPLLGARSASPASQSLLEFDGGIKVLVDVGWDDSFEPEQLKPLERHVPTLSIILLTHATPAHLAAFAHCCKHFPLFTRIPVYATNPVISLGRTLLQDLYASTPLASTAVPATAISDASYSHSSSSSSIEGASFLLQPPTSDEIGTYFSLIHPLKYSQPHQPLGSAFTPPLNGLSITAYNAGHTLGGTIWHIQHGMESIVYAVEWNQARENVLAGAAWLGGAGAGGAEVIEQLRKPTALICSSRGAEQVALTGGRKKRDDMLLDMIRAALSKGGTILIPTDSSARVLELAYLLEHAWRADTAPRDSAGSLAKAKLYLAGGNIGATMRYARSMLEWMDESIIKEFEADATPGTSSNPSQSKSGPGWRGREQSKGQKDDADHAKDAGPFDFRYLRLLQRRKQLERVLQDKTTDEQGNLGKVILASHTSLQWGFSKDVLEAIASDSRNLIILSERFCCPEPDEHFNGSQCSLGQLLWRYWEERRDGVAIEKASDGGNLEQVYGGGRQLTISHTERTPLEGSELMIYQQYQATQRHLNLTTHASDESLLPSAADHADDATSTSSSSSEESDSERQGKALNLAAALTHSNRRKLDPSNQDLGINILLRRKGVYDFDVRGKKGREKMFPFVPKRRRADDFGEPIRPEDYLKAEERDDVDGQDMRNVPHADDNSQGRLGQKRKWEDAGSWAASGTGRPLGGSIKRRMLDPTRVDNRKGDPTLGGEMENEADNDVVSEEEEEVKVFGPAKLTRSSVNIEANLRIAFVDFAGLHDKRSLQMLIPLIQPRKLILISGTEEESLSLATDYRRLLSTQASSADKSTAIDVFTPVVGDAIDASVDTNAWNVKLSELLVKHLRWQNVRGMGVVHLTGLLAAASTSAEGTEASVTANVTKKPRLVEENPVLKEEGIAGEKPRSSDLPPTLDVIPTSMASATRSSFAQPLHVGDLRLADLRKLLQSSGHRAEFRGEGTLLVDEQITVRKTGTGLIEVNGGLSTSSSAYSQSRGLEGSFNAVKRKIYDGLAVVAGA